MLDRSKPAPGRLVRDIDNRYYVCTDDNVFVSCYINRNAAIAATWAEYDAAPMTVFGLAVVSDSKAQRVDVPLLRYVLDVRHALDAANVTAPVTVALHPSDVARLRAECQIDAQEAP